MNKSCAEMAEKLSEMQAALRERNEKRERSKRTLKARQKAAQQKYYRKKHPMVIRSRKRAKRRREVAELLRTVKQSMVVWNENEFGPNTGEGSNNGNLND